MVALLESSQLNKYQSEFLVLISEERDEIHKEFCSSILDLQQKSGLRYLVLQNKVHYLYCSWLKTS